MTDPRSRVPASPKAISGRGTTAGGIVQIVLGVFLIGLMGTIAVHMAPMLLAAPDAAADGSRFKASHGAALLVMALFAAVILFGAVTIAHGVSLARTGVRLRKLLYLQWAAAGLIVVLIAVVVLALQ